MSLYIMYDARMCSPEHGSSEHNIRKTCMHIHAAWVNKKIKIHE